MNWDALLLILVGGYATFKISRFAQQYESLKYLGFALAGVLFVLGQIGILSQPFWSFNTDLIVEFTSVISISFILCALAVFIRESKPVFAQFPLIYAAIPLLLVISYWFVSDSFAIKQWLMSIYQGGAILVALLMYGTHSYRNPNYGYLLSATILFAITFIVYWFIPGMKTNYTWIWQLLLGISIIIAVKGFEFSIQQVAPVQTTQET